MSAVMYGGIDSMADGCVPSSTLPPAQPPRQPLLPVPTLPFQAVEHVPEISTITVEIISALCEVRPVRSVQQGLESANFTCDEAHLLQARPPCFGPKLKPCIDGDIARGHGLHSHTYIVAGARTACEIHWVQKVLQHWKAIALA